jgi:transposase
MENIFKKGNKITTNRLNCFEVIDDNDYQVVCRDLLTDDFSVFSKTEHKFEIADIKLILELSLKEIIEETEISEKDKQHILFQMGCRLSRWI